MKYGLIFALFLVLKNWAVLAISHALSHLVNHLGLPWRLGRASSRRCTHKLEWQLNPRNPHAIRAIIVTCFVTSVRDVQWYEKSQTPCFLRHLLCPRQLHLWCQAQCPRTARFCYFCCLYCLRYSRHSRHLRCLLRLFCFALRCLCYFCRLSILFRFRGSVICFVYASKNSGFCNLVIQQSLSSLLTQFHILIFVLPREHVPSHSFTPTPTHFHAYPML